MIVDWRGDEIIKKVAEAAGRHIGQAAEAAQGAMKSATSSEFNDTGTLHRSLTIQESNSFRDIPASASSPELGKSGVKAMSNDGTFSLFIGSAQHYIKYLFKYGYGSVPSKGLAAARNVLKSGFRI